MNYDGVIYASRSISERYPSGVNGISFWSDAIRYLPADFPRPSGKPPPLKVPCIFVSYKSQDRQYALRLAYLANQAGFEYWLDVFDPAIGAANSGGVVLTPQQKSMLIAGTIEIALLNSSHIIAAITPLTWNSPWPPYEFGRAKDPMVLTHTASSWIKPGLNASLPEFLLLAPQHHTETAVKQWLHAESVNWERSHPFRLNRPASTWSHIIPQPLP